MGPPPGHDASLRGDCRKTIILRYRIFCPILRHFRIPPTHYNAKFSVYFPAAVGCGRHRRLNAHPNDPTDRPGCVRVNPACVQHTLYRGLWHDRLSEIGINED